MTVIMLTTGNDQEIYLTDHKHFVEEKIPLSKTRGCLPIKILFKLTMKFYLTKIHNHFLSLWERIKVRVGFPSS